MSSEFAAGSSSAESARKMLLDFLKAPNNVSLVHEYDSSNAETRRFLFLELWQELQPLVNLPAADRTLPHCGRLRRLDEVSDLSSLDGFVDPFDVKDRFRNEWTNGVAPSHNESTRYSDGTPDVVSWGIHSIYTIVGAPGFMAAHGAPPDGGKSVPMSRLISSQLLLYRLIAVFGMPPSSDGDEVDGYKSVWSYTLHWMPGQDRNGEKSRFVLADYKGSYTFYFYGSMEASRSALDLLEWLVSDTVPHTYDGLLAGNSA